MVAQLVHIERTEPCAAVVSEVIVLRENLRVDDVPREDGCCR